MKEYCSFGPCSTYINETLAERGMDAIMMALRTKFGLNIKEWYFEYGDDTIYLNDAGLEILNTILVDFMMIE